MSEVWSRSAFCGNLRWVARILKSCWHSLKRTSVVWISLLLKSVKMSFLCRNKSAIKDLHSSYYMINFTFWFQDLEASRFNSEKESFCWSFLPTEDVELRQNGWVSTCVIWTLVDVKGRVREVYVDEHCVMCSIRPELWVKFVSISMQRILSTMVRLSLSASPFCWGQYLSVTSWLIPSWRRKSWSTFVL